METEENFGERAGAPLNKMQVRCKFSELSKMERAIRISKRERDCLSEEIKKLVRKANPWMEKFSGERIMTRSNQVVFHIKGKTFVLKYRAVENVVRGKITPAYQLFDPSVTTTS